MPLIPAPVDTSALESRVAALEVGPRPSLPVRPACVVGAEIAPGAEAAGEAVGGPGFVVDVGERFEIGEGLFEIATGEGGEAVEDGGADLGGKLAAVAGDVPFVRLFAAEIPCPSLRRCPDRRRTPV